MAMPNMDCQATAAQPDASLTFVQCQAMMDSAAGMQRAMSAPEGKRLGDEQMSCGQIIAEMKMLPVTGVSRERTAEGEAAAADFQVKYQTIQSETAAMTATQTARNAAAAPGGTAAAGAAMKVNMAEQRAMSDRARTMLQPAENRMIDASAASMADLAATMRTNPRFARLILLAGEKNCRTRGPV
ncbi:MAG TPA: hypothetical protein VFF44_04995 [Casimicrobiaceae bacterium]|nr:hypothetical protein [Casimicrobiaceae bacterium]